MKIRDGFKLRRIAGQNVIVSTDENRDFNNAITLNETSSYLWELLCHETTKEQMLVDLLNKYDTSTVLALNDIDVFVRTLRENGILD